MAVKHWSGGGVSKFDLGPNHLEYERQRPVFVT